MDLMDDHEDRPPSGEERDLIAGNLRRIKDLIYGEIDDRPSPRGTAPGSPAGRRDH